MSDVVQPPFLQALEVAVAKGGFETDDALVFLLPLLKQVRSAHEAGLVAPLNGISDLLVAEQGHLMFAPAKVSSPEKNTAKVEALQSPVSQAMQVVGESLRTVDIDQSSLTTSDLAVGAAGSAVTKPVFLPNYRSWEHEVGHHDELTDILCKCAAGMCAGGTRWAPWRKRTSAGGMRRG